MDKSLKVMIWISLCAVVAWAVALGYVILGEAGVIPWSLYGDAVMLRGIQFVVTVTFVLSALCSWPLLKRRL